MCITLLNRFVDSNNNTSKQASRTSTEQHNLNTLQVSIWMVLMLVFHSTLFRRCWCISRAHTHTHTHMPSDWKSYTFFCILIKWYYCVYSIKRIMYNHSSFFLFSFCCCYHRHHHHCFSLLFILCLGTLKRWKKERARSRGAKRMAGEGVGGKKREWRELRFEHLHRTKLCKYTHTHPFT